MAKKKTENIDTKKYMQMAIDVMRKSIAEPHFGYEERKALRQLSKMRTLKLIGDNGEKANSPNFRYLILN